MTKTKADLGASAQKLAAAQKRHAALQTQADKTAKQAAELQRKLDEARKLLEQNNTADALRLLGGAQ